MTDAAEEDDFELINPKDFQSIEIHVEIDNPGTNTLRREGIQILEFLDKAIALQVPEKTCSKGHSLMLKIQTENAKEDVIFKATVKVQDMEKQADGTDKVTVRMVQYEEAIWEKFCAIFEERQKEIIKYIEAVKGY